MHRLRRCLPLLGLIVAVAPAVASAQYFGRNKVQYRTFDFRVLKTPHFDIYFYPEEADGAHVAARLAERWYTRLSTLLGHELQARQPIVLYASGNDFRQTTVIEDFLGEGVGGVTEAARQRVVLPLTGSLAEFDHVLGHELVHAFQYDISGLGRSGRAIGRGAEQLAATPLWFIEGMAEYLSLGPVDPATAMWLRDAALNNNLPTIEQLARDPRFFPYRFGHALWAYIGGRYGDAVIGQILRLVGQGFPYPEAMRRLLNVSLDQLSREWHDAIRQAYLPLLAQAPEARLNAHPLITRTRGGGRLNLGPALSPDGRWVAFLSERGLFDVDLWLADGRTGANPRRLLAGPAQDPHFSSLRFIASAGSFAPDGGRLALVAERAGRDRVVVLSIPAGRVLRERIVPEALELSNPSWAPDGRTVVVSANHGGLSDLVELDLETGQARYLTNDAYADLMPAVSPDGRTVAFVTDRGAADLGVFRWGSYRIGLLDRGTGRIDLLPDVGGNAINPQWSPDGRSLLFISDRAGIPDLYRYDLESRQLHRLTRVFTGVAGITELSPALAVARSTGEVVFSAFERGGYNLYRLEPAVARAGDPVPLTTATPTLNPALLPPVPRPEAPAFRRVALYLADPLTGLPRDTAFAVLPYRPRISLDYITTPQVGVAAGGVVGRVGLYGGVAGVFSDMLGRHVVLGAVQAQGQLDEIGFALLYLNRAHRWNYGGYVQRVPTVYGLNGYTSVGEPVLVLYRFFDTSVQGVVQYPFSEAMRFEAATGYRRISSDLQIYSYLRDRIIAEESGPAYDLSETLAALVYDNALLGFTAPLAGQRFRFEIDPYFGDLRFVNALADVRRYVFRRPFSFAVRGLHFGRYGRDAENDSVFYDVYLGSPALVRGYGFSSVRQDCALEARARGGNLDGPACRLFAGLFGSRLLVASAELRLPYLRAFETGTLNFPPLEPYLFADAGLAWRSDARPEFRFGMPETPDRRGLVASAGLGVRANLFGYIVLQLDYARPFQRTSGWQWQFSIQPGF